MKWLAHGAALFSVVQHTKSPPIVVCLKFAWFIQSMSISCVCVRFGRLRRWRRRTRRKRITPTPCAWVRPFSPVCADQIDHFTYLRVPIIAHLCAASDDACVVRVMRINHPQNAPRSHTHTRRHHRSRRARSASFIGGLMMSCACPSITLHESGCLRVVGGWRVGRESSRCHRLEGGGSAWMR